MTTVSANQVYPSPGPTLELPKYEDIRDCMQCDRPANREHVAVEDCRARSQCITLVYCEHCEVIFEALWKIMWRSWELDFFITHTGYELAKYRRRIKELTCIAN